MKFCCLLSLLFIDLFASDRFLEVKKEGNVPITHFQIFSERCSGSNFVEVLVRSHFGLEKGLFGHKHFTPWLSLNNSSYRGPKRNYTFENSDDHLVLILFRNPFDWVRSFYRNPWDAHIMLKKLSFSQFIRAPWLINYRSYNAVKVGHLDPHFELDPVTHLPFRNICALRSAKIANMLAIKDLVKNCCVVQYEKVAGNPKGFLDDLAAYFDITWVKGYEPVTSYKGKSNRGEYVPRAYPQLSEDDYRFISEELDGALENRIGYIIPLVKK